MNEVAFKLVSNCAKFLRGGWRSRLPQPALEQRVQYLPCFAAQRVELLAQIDLQGTLEGSLR